MAKTDTFRFIARLPVGFLHANYVWNWFAYKQKNLNENIKLSNIVKFDCVCLLRFFFNYAFILWLTIIFEAYTIWAKPIWITIIKTAKKHLHFKSTIQNVNSYMCWRWTLFGLYFGKMSFTNIVQFVKKISIFYIYARGLVDATSR